MEKEKTGNGFCGCGGSLKLVDAHRGSKTLQCTTCKLCTLEVRHHELKLSIALRDFHLKRGDDPAQRPLSDTSMASGLIECLHKGTRPSMATIVDFGIDSKQHFVALQNAMIHGITAYDLDRVLGDGPAITWLVNGACRNKRPQVRFETAYDGLVGELIWSSK